MPQGDIHRQFLRTLYIVDIVFIHHSYGDRAFSIAAPVLWNSLPPDIRDIDNINSFKRACKGFDPDACIYCLCFVVPP